MFKVGSGFVSKLPVVRHWSGLNSLSDPQKTRPLFRDASHVSGLHPCLGRPIGVMHCSSWAPLPLNIHSIKAIAVAHKACFPLTPRQGSPMQVLRANTGCSDVPTGRSPLRLEPSIPLEGHLPPVIRMPMCVSRPVHRFTQSDNVVAVKVVDA